MPNRPFLAVAERAARAAGTIQRQAYGTLLNVDETRKNDIKLEVDRLCEAAILNEIRADFPGHSILAEESGETDTGSDHVWIIDPLDGTVNFFYGIPYFCTSIACYRRAAQGEASANPLGVPEAAVVYAPMQDELFAAEAGQGATLNGNPIRAAHADKLEDCLIATGCGHEQYGMNRYQVLMKNALTKVRKVRILGAAALDLANVAAGRISGFAEAKLYSWDIAAAAAIIAAAGGRLTIRAQEPHRWDIIGSAPAVHDKLVSLWDA